MTGAQGQRAPPISTCRRIFRGGEVRPFPETAVGWDKRRGGGEALHKQRDTKGVRGG